MWLMFYSLLELLLVEFLAILIIRIRTKGLEQLCIIAAAGLTVRRLSASVGPPRRYPPRVVDGNPLRCPDSDGRPSSQACTVFFSKPHTLIQELNIFRLRLNSFGNRLCNNPMTRSLARRAPRISSPPRMPSGNPAKGM